MAKSAKKNKVEHYDVAVIGAGPAGYVAAIRCAQLGLNTVCIDEWQDHNGDSALGGTCLNVGCIPSKALLESSHLYRQASEEFVHHGLHVKDLSVDVKAMIARKNKVVSELTRGINTLFQVNGVKQIHGRAKLVDANEIEVSSRETRKKISRITADNIIIATGSSPIRLQQAPLTDGLIIDSAGALELEEVPARVGVIGAGAIGLELGSVWSRLGAKVVLIEAMKEFLPMADSKLAKLAQRNLINQGLDIRLNSRLVSTQVADNQVNVTYEDKSGEHVEVFDKLIVAVGRKPNSDRVFDIELGIERDERSFILVDKKCRTSVPHIYAIGDVVRGPMLAHKGSEEGIMVAEHIAGHHHTKLNYHLIPYVIYTHPEIAWVGLTEKDCKKKGIKTSVGSFPMAASGRARAMGQTDGQLKIIADASTDEVLGVHIFAAQASELIAQAVLMMEMQATAEDIAMTIFAHPTLSETLHEAALAVNKKAIHMKN
jgi:dihydrolipoamide dehydrogenase